MHMENGYETDEDEALACELLAGAIDISDGEVLVKHHQPSDSIEDAFWSRSSTLILDSICGAGTTFTYEDTERLYDLLSSATMEQRVRHILDSGHARYELDGSGLTYDLGCKVYLNSEGYRSGDLYFTVWIRTRPHARTHRPSSCSPVQFDMEV